MRHVKTSMEREDIFKMGQRSDNYFQLLKEGKLFKFPEDNKLVKIYLSAKFQGNYRHIIYNCNAPSKTIYKNMVVLKKITGLIDKPLCDLTEDDMIELQSKLNQNKIFVDGTNKPIAYSYKRDIVKNIKQFWTFYRAYAKYEEGKNFENIAEYLRLRADKNSNPLVNFLTKEDIDKMANYATNLKMRVLIKVFFETGARTIEILNLRRFNCQFDSEKGKWTIKLPNMKGISTGKMPIELDYSNKDFSAWISKKEFAEDEYIFDYAYDYFRITLNEIGLKVLGKKVTPKMFRKSCAMYLVNLDVNEQYIKSHMGWAANSKAISHYINQMAIKKPEKLTHSFDVQPQDEIKELKIKLKQMEAMMLQKFAQEF